MNVIICEPGRKPRKANIKNPLDYFRRLTGGEPELLRIGGGLAAICDEDGKLKDFPYCGIFGQYVLVGTVILAGLEGNKITDVPLTLKELKDRKEIKVEECAQI